MSLLLFIFYWIGIPAFVIWLTRVFWHKSKTTVTRALTMISGIAVFLGFLWLAVGQKWMLDRQVRELCEKDGGVRVYETVKLPAEKFNKYGQVNFYRPIDGENALGPEYVWKWNLRYYRKGNPSFYRSHIQIYRKSDGKLLGESVSYKRGGGDLPGPWHGSSFMCPELSVKNDVLRQIFIMKLRSSK